MKTLFIFLLFIAAQANAATVDTILVPSKSLRTSTKCVVIKPAAYKKKNKTLFPVVYLLHGYSGAFDNWIKKVPQLKYHADALQILIVCPDGGYSSWYFDSPIDSNMRYESFIGSELPGYIEWYYRVRTDRHGKAITGLSMGGHGALFIAFRNANRFGACGSMSGGMNLYDSRNRFDIIKRLGDTITHAENWKKYSMLGVVETKPSDSLAIIFDCGINDFFFASNQQLHEKMLQLKIPHDYIERPGMHNWEYWTNAVSYQFLFFRKHFDRHPLPIESPRQR